MTTQIFIGVVTLLIVKLMIDLAARTQPLRRSAAGHRRGAAVSSTRVVVDCIPGAHPERLTHLDEVAAAYATHTPRRFWRDLFDDVERAGRDGRAGELLDERIRGLEDMRQRYARYQAERAPAGEPPARPSSSTG